MPSSEYSLHELAIYLGAPRETLGIIISKSLADTEVARKVAANLAPDTEIVARRFLE